MRLLRAADHARMAWKNGGGETVEIAVAPPGAGLGGFDWRVSAATVAVDGPFSSFPGIDRTLTLLEGAGVVLEIAGRPHRLAPGSPPLLFAGDAATTARLIAGPITDLNVMTRRGAFRHRVTRLTETGTVSGKWVLLVAPQPVTARVDGRDLSLGALDAVVLHGRAAVEGGLIAIEIDPIAA